MVNIINEDGNGRIIINKNVALSLQVVVIITTLVVSLVTSRVYAKFSIEDINEDISELKAKQTDCALSNSAQDVAIAELSTKLDNIESDISVIKSDIKSLLKEKGEK